MIGLPSTVRGRLLFSLIILCSISVIPISAQEYIDVIYMRNGTIERGTIVENIPGETIKLRTIDGRAITIQFKEIVKLAKEEAPASPEATPPAAAQTQGGTSGSGGRSTDGSSQQAQPNQPQAAQDQPAAKAQPQATAAPEVPEVTYAEIDALIRRGLRFRYDTIKGKTQYLSATDRALLFQRHEKSGGAGFALNFFIGFGIGSFVQKDVGAGVAGLLMELFSTPLYVAGMVLSFEFDESFIPMAAVGGTVLFVNYLFQWIRPAAFAAKYNRQLKNALRLPASYGMMVVPAVNVVTVSDERGSPEQKVTYGVGASIKF
jgi:hypothetical protein